MNYTSFLSLGMVMTLTGCVSTATITPTSTSTSKVTAPQTSCKSTSESEVANLFEQWNNSLKSGDIQKVVARYAEKSILLPTVSDTPRLTPATKADYFGHFLHDKPSGKITLRQIYLGCNTAVDAGLYTFTFAGTGKVVDARYSYTYDWNGKEWLITSHHSSMMPEKK